MHYLYRITDTLSNKVYIGQSNKETERWRQHKYYARQEEPIQYVHRAMAKYGVESFVYEVIAMCHAQEDADELEIQLIKQYDSRNKEHGYNVAPGGDHAWNAGLPKEQQPMYGKKQSEYQKQRMLEVHTGVKKPLHTDEWKARMSIIRTGRVVSEATKKKMSDSNKGQTRSAETRLRVSQSKIGKKLSEETKNRMSIASLGKKKSEEHIKNMCLAQRKFTPEQELEIAAARMAGATYIELMQRYHCSRSTVWKVIKGHEVQVL